MRFSVIIPVYKAEKYLKRAVNSVVKQSFTDWEIILIDDGSPDLCPQLCDKLADSDTRIKVIHQNNSGVSVARNNGIKMAQGEIICFLDADDKWSSEYLKELNSLYNNYPEIGGAFSARWNCYPDGRKALKQPQNMPEMFVLKSFFSFTEYIRTSGFSINSKLLVRTGGFKEQIKRGEDIDLMLRAFCIQRMGFLNKPLISYSVDTEYNSSSSRSIYYFPFEKWYSYDYPHRKELVIHTTGLLRNKLILLFKQRYYSAFFKLMFQIKWIPYIYYKLFS